MKVGVNFRILSSEEIEAGGFELAEEGVVRTWQHVDLIKTKGRDPTTSTPEK